MARDWQSASAVRKQNAKERVAELASRQFGRVSWAQLRMLEVGEATIDRWLEAGYLYRVLPAVYAVGHPGRSVESDLFAALLYAGPGAMQSHATGACWRGLIDYPPAVIHVSTPRRCRSLPGIVVHGRRSFERCWYRGMPTTSIEQLVLDLAATEKLLLVRKALGELDYRRQLDVERLERLCCSGRPGSRVLRKALAIHNPQLARTRSPLEDDFLLFCERYRVPLPEVNVVVHGILVDAYWRGERLVVELDGAGNHGTDAQIKRDRRNELYLRGRGEQVVRYSWDQVHLEPRLVRIDLLAELARAELARANKLARANEPPAPPNSPARTNLPARKPASSRARATRRAS